MSPALEVEVLTTLAIREPYLELVPQFEHASRQKVNTTWAGTVEIIRRVSKGECYDLIIASRGAIDDLVKLGKIAADSLVDLATSGIGVAVRRGAPRPDISSAEALKRELLRAKAVGCSTGPSGVYLASLFGRMGIEDQMRERVRYVATGMTVGPIIASGEVDIGFQQVSELMHAEEIDLVGPLPTEIQHLTMVTCGLAVGARRPELARDLIRNFTEPAARPVIERAGLTPLPAG